jgi:hypothetical protein
MSYVHHTIDSVCIVSNRYRQRPLWLVVALSLATYGLYLFWWTGATWAEMKRELDDSNMHPVWHGLSLLVPIYGLFRIHAHFRVLNEMLDREGVGARVQPPYAVILLMFAGSAGNTSARLEGPASLVLSLVSTALVAGLLVYGQAALNGYWAAVAKEQVVQRVHWGEWVTLICGGILTVLLSLALLTSG